MRRHAWTIAVLMVLAAGKSSQPAVSERGEFFLRIQARFLEPGTSTSTAPLYLTNLQTPDPKTITARAYAWFTPVEVEATRDLASIRTRAFLHDTRLPEWDLWRHRHGYTLGMARQYRWNTLKDKVLPLKIEDAKFYDSYLIAVYRLWTRRALKRRSAMVLQPEPEGISRVPIILQYDETGLTESVSGSFRIHAWHLPVDVGFTLVPSSSTHPADWWFRVHRDAFLKYDRDAWRARHAYEKTKTGYRWDSDFPGGNQLADADGKRLDLLMERGLAYWADASLHIGLFELDQQLKEAAARFRRRRYPSGP